MEQAAIVVRVTRGMAWVAVAGQNAACDGCCDADGCQSGVMSRLFASGPRQYRVLNTINAAPGDRVVVGLPDGMLLSSALAVYVLPTAGMILGALGGAAVAVSPAAMDVAAMIGAASGLCAGIVAGWWMHRRGRALRPAPALLHRKVVSCVFEGK